MKEKEIAKRLLNLQSKLQHYAVFLTSDYEKAKDLLQDTNLRTLEQLEKFKNDTNFQSWTFTIMYHIFINDWKRYSRVLFAPDIEVILTNRQKEPAYDPAEKYEIEELLNYRLTLLSEEDREIWRMYYYGFSYEEIAKRMHFPLGTVKSRIHSIRIKLRPANKGKSGPE